MVIWERGEITKDEENTLAGTRRSSARNGRDPLEYLFNPVQSSIRINESNLVQSNLGESMDAMDNPV